MVASELVTTLRMFNKHDQANLIAYLRSPYCVDPKHKNAQRALILVQLIFDALARGDEGIPDLDREVLYAAIYTDKEKYAAPTFSMLASDTLAWTREFMVMEMTKRNIRPVFEQAQILNFTREKGDFELCEKILNRLERKKVLKRPPDNHDFYHRWIAEAAKTMYWGMKSGPKGDFNMKQSLLAQEEFYLIERLETLVALFNLNNFTPVLTEEESVEHIADIDRWKHKPFFDNPIIRLSRKVLLFLHKTGPEAEKAFKDFMELLAKHSKDLPLPYLKRQEDLAFNFCAPRVHIPQYWNLLLELFRRRLEPERLDRESNITASELLSAIKLGLKQGEIELVKSLLETFKTKIKGPASSEKHYQLCLALLYSETERLEEAHTIVSSLHFHDTIYRYYTNALEARLIYDLMPQSIEHLEYKLNACKVALSRENDLNADKLQKHRHFINFMLRLNHWRMQLEKNWGTLREIKKEVTNTEPIVDKTWLLKKIDTLLQDDPNPPPPNDPQEPAIET